MIEKVEDLRGGGGRGRLEETNVVNEFGGLSEKPYSWVKYGNGVEFNTPLIRFGVTRAPIMHGLVGNPDIQLVYGGKQRESGRVLFLDVGRKKYCIRDSTTAKRLRRDSKGLPGLFSKVFASQDSSVFTLGERRPRDDLTMIGRALAHADQILAGDVGETKSPPEGWDGEVAEMRETIVQQLKQVQEFQGFK